jgi:hypothetical protein
VSVVETYCGEVLPGNAEFTTTFVASATDGFTYVLQDNDAFVCPAATTSDFFEYLATGLLDAAGSALTIQTEDLLTCYKLASKYCIRLAVTYGGSGATGQVPLLTLDTGRVKNKANNEYDDNELNTFTTTVTSVEELPIVMTASTGGVAVTYTAPATDTNTCGAAECSISSNVITLDTGDAAKYGSSTSERLKVYCGSTKLLGTFTVASSDADTVTTSENIPDCAGTTGNEVIVHRVTDYIEVNADLTSVISPGDTIKWYSSGTPHGPSRFVLSVHWSAPNGYIYLDNDESSYKNFATSDIAASTPGATSGLVIYGTATAESAMCSDRGVCDTEKGECQCFAGYTGYACNTQNNLAV